VTYGELEEQLHILSSSQVINLTPWAPSVLTGQDNGLSQTGVMKVGMNTKILNTPNRNIKKVKLSCYTSWRHMGERRYSSYSFLTSALDGGEWSASHPGRALPPGKGPPVTTGQEAGWAPEPVWTQRLEEKSSVGDRTSIVQSVVRHYTA
jgi:hypothetical protein